MLIQSIRHINIVSSSRVNDEHTKSSFWFPQHIPNFIKIVPVKLFFFSPFYTMNFVFNKTKSSENTPFHCEIYPILSCYQDACRYNPRKRMKYSTMDQDSKRRGKFSSSTSLCLPYKYIYSQSRSKESLIKDCPMHEWIIPLLSFLFFFL